MQATVRAQHPTLICLLVFLPSSFLFLPYLATNKTKDEARRRRRKVRNHVQLDGSHSSLIALFGACPFDPSFWFVAIIGTAAQWSLGLQAATNACRWLAGAVRPRFLQPFIPSWAYLHGYPRSQIALYAFCLFGSKPSLAPRLSGALATKQPRTHAARRFRTTFEVACSACYPYLYTARVPQEAYTRYGHSTANHPVIPSTSQQ